jgi:putative ABC transport system permease protein
MAALWQDVQFATRMLAKNPGFTITAAATLALGIGATTTIFSVANALLFRPLPYRDPNQLAIVTNARGPNRRPFSYLRSTFVEQHSRSFDGFAAFTGENFNLTGRGDPEQLAGMRVSWNFFDTLGVHPRLGRGFNSADDLPGAPTSVLISESLWKRRFAADPHVIHQRITLDSADGAIIGVLPRSFEFAPAGRSVDIWTARPFAQNGLAMADALTGQASVIAVARIRSGVSLDQAQAEMKVLDSEYTRDHAQMYDADPRFGIRLNPLQQLMVANVRAAVLVLFGAVGCLLLIACANIASLLLSRALSRRKEIAVRAALGGGRGAIVRQLLTENILLALSGGALGVMLAFAAAKALSTLSPGILPHINPIRIDNEVLVFALILSLAAGLWFGLAPALQLSKSDLQTVLREEGRGAAGERRRSVARNLLVVMQVALSTILLVAATLLMRSFTNLQNVPLGFNPRNLLVMDITLPTTRYSSKSQIADFFDRLALQASSLAGVRSVSFSSGLPLRPSTYTSILPEGQQEVPLAQRPNHAIETVSPSYFQNMEIPLLEGRFFDQHDRPGAQPVAIVNESFARRFWPTGSAIGKRIFIDSAREPAAIVGVCGNVRNIRLSAESVPEVYYPLAQHPYESMHIILRSDGPPGRLSSAVRARVFSIDKEQPVTNIRTMEEHLSSSIVQTRFTMLLLGGFSMIALMVASVGLYGLIAYSVAQRTRELGIRLALGAHPLQIFRLVMRQALAAALAGVLLGAAGALGVTRVIQSLLFDVSAADPRTLVASGAVFLAIAVLASYLPARQAARLDPSDTLRYE